MPREGSPSWRPRTYDTSPETKTRPKTIGQAPAELAAGERRVHVGEGAGHRVHDPGHHGAAGLVVDGDVVGDAARVEAEVEAEAGAREADRGVEAGVAARHEVGVADPVGAHAPQGQVALGRLGHAGGVPHAARELPGARGARRGAPCRRGACPWPRASASPGRPRRAPTLARLGVGLAARRVEAAAGRERQPVAERARVLGEGAAHPHRHAGDHGLRRVARPRHLVRGVPPPLVALDAEGQAAEDRLRLAARGAGLRLRAHRVVPRLRERRRAPLVRHPVVHLREVALRRARSPAARRGRSPRSAGSRGRCRPTARPSAGRGRGRPPSPGGCRRRRPGGPRRAPRRPGPRPCRSRRPRRPGSPAGSSRAR